MIGQLRMTTDGRVADKVEIAIQRLKSFEPPDGYYVAFSGGKDSQCVYHLCKMAGVKFDAHYARTSVDPPELVNFIRDNYPDVTMEAQHYDDNKPEHYYPDGTPRPITMWSLIADHTLPPTRKVRYCCAKLKEPGGQGRIVVTGVRWAESANRAKTHGVVGFQGKPKRTRDKADELGADYKLNKHGEVIMNDDNDAARRMVEQCYRTRKTMLNPIVDWNDEDVWDFLNGNNIPHCCLYDEGFKRLGCIGCPLSGRKNMERDFERWPKYKELYIRAFQRMIDNHPGRIKILDPAKYIKYRIAEDEELARYSKLPPLGMKTTKDVGECIRMMKLSNGDDANSAEKFGGGGYGNSTTGWTLQVTSEYLFRDWLQNGGQWSPWIRSRIGNGSFHTLGRSRRNVKKEAKHET